MSITSKVAEELNLDVSTVSRALNNRYGVSEKTRQRVMAQVELLSSGATSKSLRRNRRQCQTIGVIVPDVSTDFFGRLLAGIESSVSAQRGLVAISQSKYDRLRETQAMEHLVEQGVDGIILVTVDDSGEWRLPKRVANGGVPLVLADRVVPGGAQLPAILWADRLAEREAAELILNLGHRNLAFITPPFTFDAAAERPEGVRDVMIARGLPPENLRVYQSAATDARSAIIRCMHDSPRPTAIFLNDDDMAPGAYHVLQEFGLKPGVDVAVMGFGDQAVASQLHVPLTTPRQDMYLMGRKSVEMLIDRIEQPAAEIRQIRLPVPLILRESCGAVRAAVASRET